MTIKSNQSTFVKRHKSRANGGRVKCEHIHDPVIKCPSKRYEHRLHAEICRKIGLHNIPQSDGRTDKRTEIRY